MLVLVCLLTVLLMMKSGAAFTQVINAQSGEAVLLTPDRQEWEHKQYARWGPDWQVLEHKQDVRWTNPHLVMSLKKNMPLCHHGRCELLRNGSLRFSHVLAEDSGNYSLEVFAEDGYLVMKSDFFLNVQGSSSSSSPGSTVAVVVSVLLCCFILVIIFIFIFIKRRRSQNTSATTGPLEENIYVAMHGDRGNKRKGEEEEEEEEKKQEKEKQEEEEESFYVPCNAVVSLETPTTLSVDAEDIYV